MAQLYAAQGMHPYVNYASIPGYAQIAAHPQSSAAAYYPGLTYAYPHQLRPTIILPVSKDSITVLFFYHNESVELGKDLLANSRILQFLV